MPKSIGREEESLQSAFSLLESQLESTLASVDHDRTIADEKKKAEKRSKLLWVRDKILRLQVIQVELSNEDDAYMIFETLNTRGKNLGVADLVKNHLTRLLRPTNRSVDAAKDKWNSIRKLFDASAARLNLNEFIYHSWLSRSPYLGEKKLFREMRRAVKANNAMDYLDSLVADADLYRRILEPAAVKWKREGTGDHRSDSCAKPLPRDPASTDADGIAACLLRTKNHA